MATSDSSFSDSVSTSLSLSSSFSSAPILPSSSAAISMSPPSTSGRWMLKFEYAKTSIRKCAACKSRIEWGHVCLGACFTSMLFCRYDSYMWYHSTCIPMALVKDVSKVSGFNELITEHKTILLSCFLSNIQSFPPMEYKQQFQQDLTDEDEEEGEYDTDEEKEENEKDTEGEGGADAVEEKKSAFVNEFRLQGASPSNTDPWTLPFHFRLSKKDLRGNPKCQGCGNWFYEGELRIGKCSYRPERKISKRYSKWSCVDCFVSKRVFDVKLAYGFGDLSAEEQDELLAKFPHIEPVWVSYKKRKNTTSSPHIFDTTSPLQTQPSHTQIQHMQQIQELTTDTKETHRTNGTDHTSDRAVCISSALDALDEKTADGDKAWVCIQDFVKNLKKNGIGLMLRCTVCTEPALVHDALIMSQVSGIIEHEGYNECSLCQTFCCRMCWTRRSTGVVYCNECNKAVDARDEAERKLESRKKARIN